MNDSVWPRTHGQTVSVHYGNRLRAFRHFYIPSLGPPEAAAQTVDRIRKLGIEDLRWVQVDYLFDGDQSLQFGVSLGLYENEAAGDRRLEELASYGISPSTRTGFNTKRKALALETRVPTWAMPELMRSWKLAFPDKPLQLDNAIPGAGWIAGLRSNEP